MKKRWMIILIAVSMVVFGSMAFAGDGVQDKATSQNSLSGAVMLANNSQAYPQADDEALGKFRAEQEEMGQGMLLLAAGESSECVSWCDLFTSYCDLASPSAPNLPICQAICELCPCFGCP